MHQRKSKKIINLFFFLLIIVSSIIFQLNNYKFQKNRKLNISGLDEKDNQTYFE